MSSIAESPVSKAASRTSVDEREAERQAVLCELEKILTSRFFCSAGRCRQFLSYVVLRRLDGQSEQLKERVIGIEVFLRPAGYSTGDDPVVRVQAGEVRRRIEQYYKETTESSVVRIELPVGTYAPIFQWASKVAPTAPSPPIYSSERESPRKHLRELFWALGAILLILAVGVGLFSTHSTSRRKSTMEQFWNPVFTTQQPVITCVAEGLFYSPAQEAYQKKSPVLNDAPQVEVEGANVPLPWDPIKKHPKNDTSGYSDYGVVAGDVYAAGAISRYLGEIGKEGQVRIGSNCSFDDLRDAPGVIVGAFNNKWTMQLTSHLHFVFAKENGQLLIREKAPGGRVWRRQIGVNEKPTVDFAIVGRLLDSTTGQFTVAIAGIGPNGTQAASDFVTDPQAMEKGLRNAPTDWPNKNSLIVLETIVTDSVSGPPQVVAAYFW